MLNRVLLYTISLLLRFQLGNAKQRFVPNVPEECQRLGYCTLPQPDYPKEHVERLIKTLGLQNTNQSVVDSINPIRGLDPQEVELCPYIEQDLIPLVAKDSTGTWNFIINSEHYPQTYRVQICNKPDDPCSPVAHFYVGYRASCQQNFIKKVMKAIDHKGNIIKKENLMPSNCYCQVIEERRNRNTKGVKSLHVKQGRNRNPEDVSLHSNIHAKKYQKYSKGSSGP